MLVIESTLDLEIKYLRSLLVVGVEGVANCALACTLSTLLDELVVDVGLDECTTSGAATLTHVEEETKVTLLNRFVH